MANPEDHLAIAGYIQLLAGAGLAADARRFVERATELAPDEEQRLTYASHYLTIITLEDLEQGVAAAEAFLQKRPGGTNALFGQVQKNAALGRYFEAELYLERLRLAEGGAWSYAAEVYLSAHRGDYDADEDALEEALAHPLMTGLARGEVYFIVGDIDRGLAAWERMEAGLLPLMWRFHAGQEQFFDPSVVSDPRYKQMLDDLGLGDRWRNYLIARVEEMQPATGIAPSAAPVAIPARLVARSQVALAHQQVDTGD
jgi:tetratricopeptide (TPR) repeat protein